MAADASPTMQPDVKYKVFIRVPFPRGSFVDPPSANWNAAKGAELWTKLNSTPKGSGIDWEELATYFDASPSFLLQQAAWLYDRQLSHVREHLSIKNLRPASSTSTVANPMSAMGPPMKRAGSGQGSRAPSSLSIRPKLSAELKRESGLTEAGSPPQRRVPFSRTTSAATITQLHRSPSSNISPRQKPRTFSSEQPPVSPLSVTSPVLYDSSESNSSSSDEAPPVTQSRVYSRRPRYPPTTSKGKAPLNALSSADEDSDDTPSFLPFSAIGQETNTEIRKGKARPSQNEDPASTLRTFKGMTAAEQPSTLPSRRPTSASSSGTLSSPNRPSSSIHSVSSPRDLRSPGDGSRVLSALSPRQRKLAKDESEGTPSMGSSFSDLDDASISQSAMEEAMAREMQAGKGSLGVASKLGELWRQTGAGAGTDATGSKPSTRKQ